MALGFGKCVCCFWFILGKDLERGRDLTGGIIRGGGGMGNIGCSITSDTGNRVIGQYRASLGDREGNCINTKVCRKHKDRRRSQKQEKVK